jgi:hypothetical protein
LKIPLVRARSIAVFAVLGARVRTAVRRSVASARTALREPTLGELPKRTRQRRWLRAAEVDDLPLVSEDLRPLLRRALDVGAVDG